MSIVLVGDSLDSHIEAGERTSPNALPLERELTIDHIPHGHDRIEDGGGLTSSAD